MTDLNTVECKKRVAKLSPQMLAVLRSMAEGNATKQIAAELRLSEGTVKVYRERILSRLNAPNVVLAVRVFTIAEIS